MALPAASPISFADVVTEFQGTLSSNRMSSLLGRGHPALPSAPPIRFSMLPGIAYQRIINTTAPVSVTTTVSTAVSKTTVTGWSITTNYTTTYSTLVQGVSRTTSHNTGEYKGGTSRVTPPP